MTRTIKPHTEETPGSDSTISEVGYCRKLRTLSIIEKNGEQWLPDHPWCPNGQIDYGISEVKKNPIYKQWQNNSSSNNKTHTEEMSAWNSTISDIRVCFGAENSTHKTTHWRNVSNEFNGLRTTQSMKKERKKERNGSFSEAGYHLVTWWCK